MAEIFIAEHEWQHVRVECDCIPLRKAALAAGQQPPNCVICLGRGRVPIRMVHPRAWRCACGVYNVGEGTDARKCGGCHRLRTVGPERSLGEVLKQEG